MSEVERLRAAAAGLAAAPAGLGAWLGLARALEAAGQEAEAARAYVALGSAGSERGHCALAVACACWLGEHGKRKEARALVTEVARTHCKGSRRIDRSSRPRPPAPPAEAGPVAAAPAVPAATTVAEAVAAALAALAAAEGAARARPAGPLPPTALVGALDGKSFAALVGVARARWRQPDDVIVDAGEPASALYWIARGLVEASRGAVALGELRGGSFFGEIALVGGTARTARVTCREETWLLEIPADALEAAAAAAPALAAELAAYARSRLLANVMRTSELFARIPLSDRRRLLERFEVKLLPAGSQVVRAGEENDHLHVIVSGRCEVRVDGKVVAELAAGAGFGELSLLARKPATADVVAVDRTVTLSLSREGFDEVAVVHPELLAEVYKLLVERERQNRDAIHHDAADLVL